MTNKTQIHTTAFWNKNITKFSPLSHNCLLKLSLFIKKKLRKQNPTLKNLLNVSNQPNLTSFVYHATDVIFLIWPQLLYYLQNLNFKFKKMSPLNKTWLEPQTTSVKQYLRMTLILTVTNTNIHISQSLFVNNDKKTVQLRQHLKQWGYILYSI